MTYSDDALIFAKIPVSEQIRLEDRVSYLYLEYCQVIQNHTGVAAISEGNHDSEDREPLKRIIQIPVAGLAVLFLGPGTSITQPAMASCSRAGLTVIFSGGGGCPYYSHAMALTSSSRWAIAQAHLVADERNARKAAKFLYKRQLGIDIEGELTISQMRGLEGSLIKKRYRELSREFKVNGFRRDTGGEDVLNQALNLVNGILYGCAASACAALGVNPALGIIHRGDIRSLLFDVADLYKPNAALPISFRSVSKDEPLKFARKEMRRFIYEQNVLENMISILMSVLEPYLPTIKDDMLIDESGEVPGHKDYSN
ncbi:CRISPR-associated protein Cas1 [Mobiluncus mulieris]|uniref:CRISPR-associated endonuclease Cas1 n=1 Tax=Mobiluncus mulieris TaxID=2052 RepID=A0A8G2M691_9ACTO|nr:CRISPR-associated endonuclease Cas1 [Mobiluncus mulieris]MBB5846384.1 CRISPR-associated protein Cas1 [Mobiluncus mulieris]MCV0012166.1 type I-E CRISPR-associated endonuclease Cas1 [Mobiluncus mulieris]STO17135.1 CRISPR-associated endonuclease Cas1, subtype I-E/ECOLI [Mobiluncus mulieris]